MATPVSAKWPVPSDYAEVLQYPRLCFQDALLKAGQFRCNPSGLPHIITGNYAGVCEMRNGAQHWAVRCFLRQVSDRERRYNIINQHLKVLRLPSLAGFEYLQQGIRVHGHWYPIVKMEWVEGDPLHTFVARCLNNSYAMLRLATELRVLLNNLHANHVAHGDLQHDNVRVTPLLHLRLVDYDTMFVPSLRGILSPEIGHANYQHPQRTNQDYNEDLDNFSALVIYTSLLALATHPDLWQQHHTGENLIFSANDFITPQQSILLQQLKRSTNPEVQKLAAQVEQCCMSPLAQVPKLEVVIAAQNIQQRPVVATPILQPQSSVQQRSVNLMPPLQLQSLVFYEAGDSRPEKGQRRYSTYFPQSATRYIDYEINLINQMCKQGNKTYHFEWHYFRQNGSLLGKGQADWVIKSEWETCWFSSAWGWQDPGQWAVGNYRVEIFIEGIKFAEGSFGIIQSLNGWNSNLELVSLRFYESGSGFPEKGQRRYSTYFPQSIARYINFEINVRNYYRLLDKMYQMKWRYYNATGNLMWEYQDDWIVRESWSNCWFTRGCGWKDSGHWEPGNYRTIILIDGVEFAEGSFTIEHSG